MKSGGEWGMSGFAGKNFDSDSNGHRIFEPVTCRQTMNHFALTLFGILALSASMMSCGPTIPPDVFDANADPLARAAGGLRWDYMGSARYDAAFVIDRQEKIPFDSSKATVRAAFNHGTTPERVGSVDVNGATLTWESKEMISTPHTYFGVVPFGPSDSVRLSVLGFNGEEVALSCPILPPFEFSPTSDTLDLANGFRLHYANPQTGGTVHVNLIVLGDSSNNWSFHTELPDNGNIVIPRDSFQRHIDLANSLLVVQVWRYRMDSITTANGQRIGVPSETDFGPIAWPVKN
jgi:hypothetical protein